MIRAILIACLALGATAVAQEPETDRRAVLDAFIEAFNRQDVDAMVELVTPDVAVIYLGPATIEDRVDGAEALAESMRSYFASFPTAGSVIVSAIEDGDRLAVRERASWVDATGQQRSQTALAVYHIVDGRVAAAWYHPATRATGQ